MVDVNSMEWFTVVPADMKKSSAEKDGLATEERGKLVPCEDPDMGDSYVLVQEGDLADALSEFVTKTVTRYDEHKHITPDKLQKVLHEAFVQLREPSTVGKLYGWAQFLYR